MFCSSLSAKRHLGVPLIRQAVFIGLDFINYILQVLNGFHTQASYNHIRQRIITVNRYKPVVVVASDT